MFYFGCFYLLAQGGIKVEEIKVSIIVPIYNGEVYIKRCIDSLINQTLRNIEIILIDDGSTDTTPEIVDEYSNKGDKIKVFHKSNGGVSEARNFGVKNANGIYILFVDADDWCEPDMAEKMYTTAMNNLSDLVCVGYSMDDENGKTILINKSDSFMESSEKDEIAEIISKTNISYAVTKLYKLSLIQNNEIFFKTNLSLGEDALFVYDYLLNVKSMAVIDEVLYHYVRCNDQSLSTKYVYNIDQFIEIIFDKKRELFERFPMYKELSEEAGYKREISSTMMYIFNNYKLGCPLNSKERRTFIKQFMTNANIDKVFNECTANNLRDRIFLILYKLKSPLLMDLVYSMRLLTTKLSKK